MIFLLNISYVASYDIFTIPDQHKQDHDETNDVG